MGEHGGLDNNRGVFARVDALPPGSSSGSTAVLFVHTTAGTGGRVSNFERGHVFGDGHERIRVVHASPDAPAVDVYVNDKPAFTGLAFHQVAGFIELPAGTYAIDLRAAGADPASPPAYQGPLALAPDATYTTVAAGSVGASTPDEGFRVLSLVEEFASPTPAPPASRCSRARPCPSASPATRSRSRCRRSRPEPRSP